MSLPSLTLDAAQTHSESDTEQDQGAAINAGINFGSNSALPQTPSQAAPDISFTSSGFSLSKTALFLIAGAVIVYLLLNGHK